ncbi:hypothetical protein C8Q76DRAFT_606084, partial [Earliella scabrosa]
IPCNPNCLIDLKQSIMLLGMGIAQFESVVKGLLVIYQMFKAEIAREILLMWQTCRDSEDLVLYSANRILTFRKDTGKEEAIDLVGVIDPLNILHPLLHGEVHLQDNIVEYQEQCLQSDSTKTYVCITSDRLPLTGLVERQVGFAAVHLGHQEYAFLSKSRAVCLLEHQDYNAHIICTLMAKSASPLKKVKHKVRYSKKSDKRAHSRVVALGDNSSVTSKAMSEIL